ncbi:MAG TPA: hypothetical protein VGO93_06625 [Candidatus Xenobia bacterium]
MGIAIGYGAELEQAAVAARLDDELRFLVTAHTPVQRAIGSMLVSLLQDSSLIDLGYALRKDYLREHLGIGVREAQELAWLETHVVRYPETDRLWRTGHISRCHVRVILRHAAPEEDFLWARLATIMSVRCLEQHLVGQPDPEEETMILALELPPELQSTWDVAFEVACRLWERDISEAEFLETLAAEFQSGASDDLFAATLDDDMPNPAALRAELQRLVAEAEEKAERETGRWRHLSWRPVRPACVPEFSCSKDATVFDMDRGVRQALVFQQSLDDVLLHKLWEAERLEIHRPLQFATFQQYLVERLGFSTRQAYRLRQLRRALVGQPEVAEAHAQGTLTRCQAAAVAGVATPPTVEAWIAYAEKTTVDKLQRVVSEAMAMQEQGRRDVLPPLPLQPSPETQALLDEALARMPGPTARLLPTCSPVGASESERAVLAPAGQLPRVPDAVGQVRHAATSHMRIRLPRDLHDMVVRTLGMAEAALGGHASKTQCVELLLNHFLSTWARVAMKAARENPILERDSWQCVTPGCTSRTSLQGHHVMFKSQGGSDKAENQGAICACHHLRGIHQGRLRARGQAPDGLVWETGIRPDGVPSRIYLNDTLVAETV